MRHNAFHPLVLLLFLVFTFACNVQLLAQQPPRGTVITVNSLADAVDASAGNGICADIQGRCTLRAAIEEANALPGRDAIIFDVPTPASINLLLGELRTTDAIGIYGRGARQLTIQRNDSNLTPNFRVFHFSAPTELRGVTVKNGFQGLGGGILVATHSKLYDVVIKGNTAGTGGGIAFQNSEFQLSSMTRCLVESNVSQGQGGGIYVAPGMWIEIKSSTITNNSAIGGGGVANSGALIFVNNTVARNSASKSASGMLNSPGGRTEIINTIIGPSTSHTPLVNGAFASLGRNIVTNTTGSTGWVSTDQTSSSDSIDPLLGPLSNNGGPTDSLALLSGSPAIDTGDNCVVVFGCGDACPNGCSEFRNYSEQRRTVRQIGARVDIGALESGASTATVRRPTQISFGDRHRFTFSRISIVNTETLERISTFVTASGASAPRDLDLPGTYVYELHSKRQRLPNPDVLELIGGGN